MRDLERELAEALNECARLQQALAVCGEHLEDCCRTDIDWRSQNESHDAAARAIAALAGPDTPADSPEPREGIVMVYDWEHRYLGCMGIERWQEILDADRREPMPEACPRCGCLTYKLVNNSLHMDAPDGAVICDNCGKGWVHSTDEHGLIRPADSQEDEWFIPEGDRQCGVVHKMARATCMKRRGHDGSHATPQGTWIDGPWCEYPADSQEDKT